MAAVRLPEGLFKDVSVHLPRPLRGDGHARSALAAIFFVVWGGGSWERVDAERFGCSGEDARRLYRLLRDLGTWERIERVVLNEMSRGRFRNWAAA